MIAVDVEASGTDYARHSMVSVGAVDIEKPERQFYGECRIWDGAHVMDEALLVNGFTKEQITDPSKQTESDLVHAFISWAMESSDRTLSGQNVSFDRDFLKAAAARAHHTDWPFAYRTIDVHTLAVMHMVKRGLKLPLVDGHSAVDLDAALVYCGIPEEPTPHNALTGAKSHAEVISRLLFDKPILPEFKSFAIPWLAEAR